MAAHLQTQFAKHYLYLRRRNAESFELSQAIRLHFIIKLRSMEYIDLNRHFFRFHSTNEWEASRFTFGSDDPFGSLNWETLLKEWRVVVLAEAGAGKTEEFRNKPRQLCDNGIPAFYVTVNALADKPLERALSGAATRQRLKDWKDDDGIAHFFVDSVDEARLNGKNIEDGLDALAEGLDGALHRAKIILSCRVLDWRRVEDMDAFQSILRAPQPGKTPGDQDIPDNPDDAWLRPIFRDNNDKDDANSVDTPSDAPPLVVSLGPLSRRQASSLARAAGVTDEADFLNAVSRADAEDLANRPLDLIDLARLWKAKKRIGTRAEILDWSIQLRLQETNRDRRRGDRLSLEDALSATHDLAAALTISRKRLIIWSDAEADPNDGEAAIDPGGVLKSFDASLQDTLFARPIFEAAAFGRIKFQHRSVQEYMTARWLRKLSNMGLSESRLWNFLTAETYGIRQLRPALRPVAAWLGQLHAPVRRRLMTLAPEVLIEDGDPSLLPVEIRAQLLRSFAKVHAGRDESDVSISIDQLVRLADPKLAPCVRELWAGAKHSGELRGLLLRLMWAGGIADCTDLAMEAALNTRISDYHRITAIRAIEEAGTLAQKKTLVAELTTKRRAVDERILAAVAGAAFPEAMSPTVLAAAIGKVSGPRKKTEPENLLYSLERKLAELDVASLINLNKKLLALVQTQPFIDRRSIEISSTYSWVTPLLAAVCAETLPLIDGENAPPSVIEAARICFAADRYQLHYRLGDYAKRIRKAIAENRELNRTFFWADVKVARKKHGNLDGHWRAYHFGGAWRLDRDDFDWLAADVTDRSVANERLVALTAAYSALGEDAKSVPELAQLKKATEGDKKLKATLNRLINPPPIKESEEERRFRREDAIYKAQREQRRKKNAASWIALRERITALGGDIPTKISFGDLYDLARWLQWASGDRSRYGDVDTSKLDIVFGSDVANQIRNAFKRQWRKFEAPLRSEKTSGGTPYGTIVGLIGLRIESDEDPGATQSWTPREAKRATRYALDEMNGFPDWATELCRTRKRIVSPIFGQEIDWHIARKSKSGEAPHYIIDMLAYADQAIISAVSDQLLASLEAASPHYTRTLNSALRALLRDSNLDCRRLSALALKRIRTGRAQEEKRLLWLAALMHVDARPAMATLQKWLGRLKSSARSEFFTRFLSAMFDSHEPGFGGVHRDFEQVDILETFVRLTYAHIRPEDDIEHDGAYSPGARDHAEDARNYLLGRLLDTPGRQTYKALTAMADDPGFVVRRERFLILARRRAASDGDLASHEPEDVHEIAERHAAPPRNARSLFERVGDAIDDVADDIMHDDYSLKEEIRQDATNRVDEKKVQNWFTGALNNKSNDAFNATREEEISDKNEPDVMVRRTDVKTRIPIEVKVADSWSVAKLEDAVINQLLEKYMRPQNVNHGVLFLTWHGKQQRWRNPLNGQMMNFDRLCAYLQSYADRRIDADFPSKTILVKAADLTAKNLSRTPVKNNAKKSTKRSSKMRKRKKSAKTVKRKQATKQKQMKKRVPKKKP